jgi:hypothetical protein
LCKEIILQPRGPLAFVGLTRPEAKSDLRPDGSKMRQILYTTILWAYSREIYEVID